MDNMDSLWSYQESVDELKQQLLYTTLELESVKAEAGEHMKMHKEYEKQLLQFLNMVIQERDEAREQLHKLLNKLMAPNLMIPRTEFLTSLPQLSPETPLMNPTIPNLSTTESNSFSEPCNYQNSQNSSPVSSFFEAVSSPELSNMNNQIGDLSNKMGFVNQPFVQDYKGLTAPSSVPPSAASRIDQVIDNLVKGKPLPQKGKFLQSVLEAGPLIQTLLVAGPLPTWRNPPPLQTFHMPHLKGKGYDLENVSQQTSGKSAKFSQCFQGGMVNGRAIISPSINGNNSSPTGKRQRFH